MRKRITYACVIGIFVCGICGCAQTDEDTLAVESEIVGQDYTETESEEDVETESAETETAIPAEEYSQREEAAEPIYIINPQLTQDDTYEMQDWQAAYAEYIESVEYAQYNKYTLIYVDEDDIPELVIYTGTYATACTVLTFHNGEVDALQTGSLQCNYIEKKNLYRDAGGQMGEYFDHIYSIENGKWVHAEGGEYSAKLNEEGMITEEYDYTWEGEAVSKDEYYEDLYAAYDIEKNRNVEFKQYERLDEILFRLQTGTALSRTHRYELYIEDVTWDEAKKRCEEKSGYLAAITSIEEYELIKKGIEDSGQTQVAYWVDGEPGYYRQAAEEKIDKTGAYLLYDDSKKDYCLYDAPMDMPTRNPEYTGRIGYICEYDSVMVMSKYTFYTVYGSMNYWHEFEYDSAGNMIKDTAYRIGHDSIWHWYMYEYDSAGNRTKEIHYGVDGGGDWRFEYEYDSAGNRTKEIHYTADGGADWWFEYEYDSAGNLTRRVQYEADGSVEWWEEHEYDIAGNEAEIIIHNTNDITGRYEYKYDNAGNKTSLVAYEADGSVGWRKEYEYDGSGNLIKETDYDSDFVVEEREWEYDYMGNSTMLTVSRRGEGSERYEYEYIMIVPH